jgi:hypothetical protein
LLLAGGVLACSATEAPASSASDCPGVELLVAASSHYDSSMVCGAPTRCELGGSTTGADLGKDPSLALSNGRAFFLARDQDAIFELDPTCGTPFRSYSVHSGSAGVVNPHDLAVASDGTLFVPLFNVPQIAIVKDGKLEAPIDLSSSDFDGDGNPNADAIRIVPVDGAEKAFVTLERLDNTVKELPSRQVSWMLRIDVATRKIEDHVVLAGRNPFNTMAELNGALFLAEPRDFDVADEDLAGIERFDTKTSTTQLLVRESDLGGSVSEVAVIDGCGVAIVGGPVHDVNPTSLVTFDPATGKVLASASAPVLGPTAGYDLQGLAWSGDSLYVGDRRAGDTGYPVHVFARDPGTCILHEVTAQRPAINLPQGPVALRAAH